MVSPLPVPASQPAQVEGPVTSAIHQRDTAGMIADVETPTHPKDSGILKLADIEPGKSVSVLQPRYDDASAYVNLDD